MQQQQSAPLTFEEKKNVVYNVLAYPALTVEVFARRKLGYRRVTPVRLFIMAAIIVALPSLTSANPGNLSSGFRPTEAAPGFIGYLPWAFAAAMVAWGLWQRRSRWNELVSGKKWHTRSAGVSHLEPLLLGRIKQNWIYRFVDPAVCAIAGIALLPVSPPLGSWVIFSAFSLYIVEQLQYEHAMTSLLDGIDAQVESQVQADDMAHFDREGATASPLSRLQTAGMALATGLEPRLGAQAAKRARERAIDLPDDNDGGAAAHLTPSPRGL